MRSAVCETRRLHPLYRWFPAPLCDTLGCVHHEGFHRGLLSLRGPPGRPASLAGRRSSCLSGLRESLQNFQRSLTASAKKSARSVPWSRLCLSRKLSSNCHAAKMRIRLFCLGHAAHRLMNAVESSCSTFLKLICCRLEICSTELGINVFWTARSSSGFALLDHLLKTL